MKLRGLSMRRAVVVWMLGGVAAAVLLWEVFGSSPAIRAVAAIRAARDGQEELGAFAMADATDWVWIELYDRKGGRVGRDKEGWEKELGFLEIHWGHGVSVRTAVRDGENFKAFHDCGTGKIPDWWEAAGGGVVGALAAGGMVTALRGVGFRLTTR